MAEQIPAEDYKKLFVLDVREASQFAKDHIPGAVNIEWRKVFAERAKLPKDKTVLVYCNTSSFSAQVAMALRMDGFENVRILHGGYGEWKARGGTDAFARATKADSAPGPQMTHRPASHAFTQSRVPMEYGLHDHPRPLRRGRPTRHRWAQERGLRCAQ